MRNDIIIINLDVGAPISGVAECIAIPLVSVNFEQGTFRVVRGGRVGETLPASHRLAGIGVPCPYVRFPWDI